MIKKFGKWMAIAMIALLAFVGVFPQQVQAQTTDNDGSTRGSICDIINTSDTSLGARYATYVLSQPQSDEILSGGAIKVTFYGTTMLSTWVSWQF